MVVPVLRTFRAALSAALLLVLAVATYAAFRDGGLTGAVVLRAGAVGGIMGAALYLGFEELPRFLNDRRSEKKQMARRRRAAIRDREDRNRRTKGTYARIR